MPPEKLPSMSLSERPTTHICGNARDNRAHVRRPDRPRWTIATTAHRASWNGCAGAPCARRFVFLHPSAGSAHGRPRWRGIARL